MMYTRIILITLFVSQTVLFSCQADSGMAESASVERMASADYDQSSQPAQAPVTRHEIPPAPPEEVLEQEVVLLRTAKCRMEVEGIKEQVEHIEALLTENRGYLSDLTWNNYSYRAEASMTARIPAAHFNWLLDTVANLGVNVDYQEINTQDVTEEYVDLQSRLKTKREVLKRYEEILRAGAKTIDEVLQSEQAILRLQEEIEAKEGRLRYLSQRAKLSTITIELYEPKEEVAASTWWQELGEDMGNSLAFSMDLIKGIFLSILGLWPVILLLGWLFWQRKKIWRRLRPKEQHEN